MFFYIIALQGLNGVITQKLHDVSKLHKKGIPLDISKKEKMQQCLVETATVSASAVDKSYMSCFYSLLQTHSIAI